MLTALLFSFKDNAINYPSFSDLSWEVGAQHLSMLLSAYWLLFAISLVIKHRFINVPSMPPKFNREQFLEAVLESAVDFAIIAIDTEHSVMTWNEGARRILQWTDTEMIGKPISAIFTEQDCLDGIPQREMQAALDGGRGFDERWHLRKDGSTFWANGEMMPLRATDGMHIGFLKILRDRTEQRMLAEKERSNAEFLRSVLASSADCIKVLDLDARLIFMNDGGQRVMEVTDFAAIEGCPWPEFWVDQGNVAAKEAVIAAKSGGIGQFRGMADTFAGNPRWWDVQVTPIMGADARPEKLLAVSRDITKSVRGEEQVRLLGDELQHRVKNTLTMVQAIVRQTLRTAASPEAALEAIDLRLAALGRAHSLLTQGEWNRSSLSSIVGAALGSHDDGDQRFQIEGPEVQLHATAAMSLALLLHELATNATKYGALSIPGGSVSISWTVRPEGNDSNVQARLDLLWREQNGPPVLPPARRGFGSRLIERSLASSLNGTAVINFLNEGVTCHVSGIIEMLPP